MRSTFHNRLASKYLSNKFRLLKHTLPDYRQREFTHLKIIAKKWGLKGFEVHSSTPLYVFWHIHVYCTHMGTSLHHITLSESTKTRLHWKHTDARCTPSTALPPCWWQRCDSVCLQDSPLHGATGLSAGDLVTAVDECRVLSRRDWLSCLAQAASEPQTGYCVSTDIIATYDETINHGK